MPIIVSPAVLPLGTVGEAYSVTFQATGGTSPYAWSDPWKLLPRGLAIDAASGELSGVPCAAVLTSIVVGVFDSEPPSGRTFYASRTLVIRAAPLRVTTTALPAAVVGRPYWAELTAAGGQGEYGWSIGPGALPAGLSLDAGGVISGVPAAPAAPSPVAFTVAVQDGGWPPQHAGAPLTLVVEAQGVPWVYATNNAAGSVSQYHTAAGVLAPASPAQAPANGGPLGVAATPDGASLYVANGFAGNVSQYDIDPITGALTPKAVAAVAAGAYPRGVAVSPDGRNAYVTNARDDTVSQFTVDAESGALSPKAPPAVPTGQAPQDVAIGPDGRSAYVANGGGESLSQYDIDPTAGTLTPKLAPAVAAAGGPCGVAVSRDGRSLYATAVRDDRVLQYDVATGTGSLTPKAASGVACGKFPTGIALSPDGRSAYVANVGGESLSQYNIDPTTGALTSKPVPAVAAAVDPSGVALSPDGTSAFVASLSNSVAHYAVDMTTGTLSLVATVPADGMPFGVAVVSPYGRPGPIV